MTKQTDKELLNEFTRCVEREADFSMLASAANRRKLAVLRLAILARMKTEE